MVQRKTLDRLTKASQSGQRASVRWGAFYAHHHRLDEVQVRVRRRRFQFPLSLAKCLRFQRWGIEGTAMALVDWAEGRKSTRLRLLRCTIQSFHEVNIFVKASGFEYREAAAPGHRTRPNSSVRC